MNYISVFVITQLANESTAYYSLEYAVEATMKIFLQNDRGDCYLMIIIIIPISIADNTNFLKNISP